MKRQETLQRSVARAAEKEASDILTKMSKEGVEFLAKTSAYNAMLAKARAEKAKAQWKLEGIERNTAYFGSEICKLGETAARENWDNRRIEEATKELQARLFRETGSIVNIGEMAGYVKDIRKGKSAEGFHSVDVSPTLGERKSELGELKRKLREHIAENEKIEKDALRKLNETEEKIKAANKEFRRRTKGIIKRYGVLPKAVGFAKEKPSVPAGISPAVRGALWAARHTRSLPLVEQRMRKLKEKAKGVEPLVRIYEENLKAAEDSRRNAKKLEEKELINFFTFLQKQGLLKKSERRDMTWHSAKEMLRMAKAPKAKVKEYEKALPLVSKYSQFVSNARSASAIAEKHMPHHKKLGEIKTELEYLHGIRNQMAEAQRLRETGMGVAKYGIRMRRR